MARRGFSRGVWVPIFLLAAAAGCNRSDAPQAGVTASVSSATDASGSSAGGTAPLQETFKPVVKIETTLGAVTVELDGQRAPITVKNFLWYVNNGHYRETIFHQVLPGYVAIGGGYTAEMVEKPTLIAIRNEADTNSKNTRGTLAMARRPDAIDSSTCQFFFNLADNTNLDQKGRNNAKEFGYCVFGRVIDGLEVLDRLSAAQVGDKGKFASVPLSPIVIKTVTRVR